MLDIGKTELLVVIIILLLVVGPRELPHLLRTFFGFMRKMRGMVSDFQHQIEQVAKDSELDKVQQEVQSLKNGDASSALLQSAGIDAQTQEDMNALGKNINENTKSIDEDAESLLQEVEAEQHNQEQSHQSVANQSVGDMPDDKKLATH